MKTRDRLLYNRLINHFTSIIRTEEERLVNMSWDSGSFKSEPYFADMYFKRGFIYTCLGLYEAAISDYSQALFIDENFIKGYYERGLVYQIQGKVDLAIKDYSKTITLDSQFKRVRSNLNYIFLNLKSGEEIANLSKEELFLAMTQLQPKDQILIFQSCLLKTTPLGHRVWKKEFPYTGCSLDSGILKKIVEQLKLLVPALKVPTKEMLNIAYKNGFFVKTLKHIPQQTNEQNESIDDLPKMESSTMMNIYNKL